MVPKHRFRKFAVVSDRQRYDQLVAERGETSVWYRRPIPGLAVNDPEVFALEQFTINGRPIDFTRQADDVSQVYTVDLGQNTIDQGQSAVVAFNFRTLVPRDGHVVHINIDRPTKGLDVELTYDSSSVKRVRLMDFASRGDGGCVSEEPETSVVRYRYDGWLFPRAGLVFAWTLATEADQPARPRRPGRQRQPTHDNTRSGEAA